MKDVAIFEKISLDEYLDDIRRIYPFHDWSLPKEIEEIYKNIRLPQRMKETTGSYYFYTPFDFTLTPGTTVLIPTGIKCKILKEDVSLFIFPDEKAVRTSITLSNGVQIVNAEDYDNEDGQIYIYLEFPCNWNDGYPRTTLFGTQLEKVNQPIHYIAGDAIAQASFLEFGVVENDVPVVEDEEEEGNNSENVSGSDNTNPGGKENITDDDINNLLDDDTTENGTDDPTPNTGDDNNNTEEPGGENTDPNQNENPDEPTGNTDPDPNEPSGDNPTDPVDPDPTDPNEGTDTPTEPDPVEPTTGDNTDDPVDPDPSTTEPVTEP